MNQNNIDKIDFEKAKKLLERIESEPSNINQGINLIERQSNDSRFLDLNRVDELTQNKNQSDNKIDFEKAKKLLERIESEPSITSLIDKNKNQSKIVNDDKTDNDFVPFSFDLARKLLENLDINELDSLINKANDSEEVLNHEKFQKTKCSLCNKNDFYQYRYKCLECTSTNYNLCGECFEERVETREHKLSHAVVRRDEVSNSIFGETFNDNEINLNNFSKIFANVQHKEHTCNGCKTGRPIIGLRFKCDICKNFDLCKNCFFNKKSIHPKNDHPFIVFGKTLDQIDPSGIKLLKELGSGAFGSVYEAKLKNGILVAAKIIDPSRLDSYIKEKEAYDELIGVNILKCFGYSYFNQKPMIITELMKKGSLSDLLKKEKLSYRRRLQIACDIASGMLRIHDHNFIHHDIRDDNVLIAEDYTAKIGDMGIVRTESVIRNTTPLGKPDCMPPEFFHHGKIDQNLDVFTYGLILNQLFDGQRKFIPPNTNQDYTSSFRPPNFIKVTTKPIAFFKLVSICLNADSKQRPNSKRLLESLKAYRKVFNDYFEQHHPDYNELDINTKNEMFKQFYSKLPDEKILRK